MSDSHNAIPPPGKEPAAPSRLFTAVFAVVAVVLYLVLVDAAVETFLSGSPLRWWIAGVTIFYLALCAATWRLMPKLRLRMDWATRAALSAVVLLALVSATAWMSGGLERGLRLFGQPTSIILAIVSAVAVAISGILLARLRFVPLAGKIVAGVLAAYGAAAFLLAVKGGTSYPALFHGFSQWTRLPVWLQGATVSGWLVVPAGLLLGAFPRLRSNPTRGDHPRIIANWFVLFALALSMAIFLSGMRTPVDNSGLEVRNAPSSENQSAYDRRVSAAHGWPDAIKSYLDRFPDTLINLDALAASLQTPEAAFQYVRDEIALEPYPGVLKGAQATLVTRGGADLDRALLLAFLLDKQGISAQIAHGRLSSQQSAALLQQITMRPDATQLILASMPADEKVSNSGASTSLQDFAAAQREEIEEVSDRAFVDLQSSLQAAHIDIGQDMSHQQLDILADHFWVEARIKDQVVELDPSFADAKFGQKFADVTDTFGSDQVDQAQSQKVILRAVAAYLQNGVISPKEILHAEFKASDLWGKNIRFAILPTSNAQNVNEFQPQLNISGDVTAGQAFSLEESGTSAAGDISGALAGGSSQASATTTSGGSALGRLYFEVETLGPHLAPSHSRRTILDRIGDSSGQPIIDVGMTDPKTARALLIQVWDGSIAVGPVHPLFVVKSTLEWLQMYVGLQEKLLGAKYLGKSYKASELPGPLLSPRLLTFALASGLREHDLQAKSASSTRAYYERPRLLFFRRGYLPTDLAKPSAPPTYREGIDLINAPFGFVGNREATVSLAMKWGLSDTAFELNFGDDENSFNTFPILAAASSQRVSLDVLDGDGFGRLSSLSVPAALRNVLEEDLAKGKAILAPETLVRMNASDTYGWWSVEKSTGYTIGKAELGGAQGLSEYSAQQTLLQKYPTIAGNLVGDIEKCYMAQIVSSLSGDTEGSDTEKCVTTACCKALAELVKIEVGAAPGLLGWQQAKDEELTIKQLLANYLKKEGKRGTVKRAGTAAQSACEGQ